jgi:hypothetical protein
MMIIECRYKIELEIRRKRMLEYGYEKRKGIGMLDNYL